MSVPRTPALTENKCSTNGIIRTYTKPKYEQNQTLTGAHCVVDNVVSDLQVVGAVDANSCGEAVVERGILHVGRSDGTDGATVEEGDGEAWIVGVAEAFLSRVEKLYVSNPRVP